MNEKPHNSVKYSVDSWIYFIGHCVQMKGRKDLALLAISLPADPGYPLTFDARDHSDAVIMTQYNIGTSGGCPRVT